MGLRGRRLATVVSFAMGACAAGGLAIAGACIPDLPADQGGSGGRADGGWCGDGIVQLALGERCDPGSAAPSTSPGGCTADCKVACPGGFVWPRNDHCYEELLGPSSFTEAISRCTTRRAHVVTFASEDELEAVARGLDAGDFWVGLYDDGLTEYVSVAPLEPGWAPTCAGCFAHTPGPTALPSKEAGCIEAPSDLDSSWQPAPCTDAGRGFRVVCEYEPLGRLSTSCEAGICIDVVSTFGNKRYVYEKIAAPPDVAEQNCRALGGSLVVLQTRDEREQLWKELARMPGEPLPNAIWLGLSLVDGGSPDDPSAWVWDDDAGADAYAPAWADRQPVGRPLGGGARAFANQSTGSGAPPLLDNTLARDRAFPAGFAYVCQVPDGGGDR